MGTREITFSVTEELYEQLADQARSSAQPIGDLVSLALARQLALVADGELSAEMRAELNAIGDLSDDALWAIARSVANPDKIALYDLLAERQLGGTLTPEGQQLLRELRNDLDAVALRKAHAFVLLRSRGIDLPSLDELRSRSR